MKIFPAIPDVMYDRPDYDDQERISAQKEAESTYFDKDAGKNWQRTSAYRVRPLGARATVSPRQLWHRMEVDHVIKKLPTFRTMRKDETRRNKISGADDKRTLTEHEALNELYEYLRERADGRVDAVSLLDNLSFIGKHEYIEASQGLAQYWVRLLDYDPTLMLYVVGDAVSAENSIVKSDVHLTNKIFSYIDDETLDRLDGRLRIGTETFNDRTSDNYRVALVDDWIISGEQMSSARHRVRRCVGTTQFRQTAVEIHSIVASPERIITGMEHVYKNGEFAPVPVRAYYMAHAADRAIASSCGAHITGAHSTVDYDFSNAIPPREFTEIEDGVEFPVLADVDTPYKKKLSGYLSRYDRKRFKHIKRVLDRYT